MTFSVILLAGNLVLFSYCASLGDLYNVLVFGGAITFNACFLVAQVLGLAK